MLNYEIDKVDNEVIEDCFYIINKYLRRNKIIDLFFLEEVVEVVKNKKNLSEYVKKVGFDNHLYNQGSYLRCDKSILINYDKFLKTIEHDKILFDSKIFNIYSFIRMISLVLHEIEHANQEVLIKSDDSLESFILRETTDSILQDEFLKTDDLLKLIFLLLKINRHERIYNRYYEFAPEERLAYIKSSTWSLKLAELFEFDRINNLMECFLCYEYIKGYAKKLYPTKFYFKKLYPNSEVWDKIENMSKDLDFSKRFLYGLEISEYEYDGTVERIKETLSKFKEQNKILIKKRR